MRRSMNKLKKISMFAGASASAITIASFAATPAFSQETEISDQIVILGSRGLPRSAVESPVAVDSVSADELLATGASETGRILQELVPSFNFSSSSISDGTDSLRPATLRGLGPDQTLVLINGKRRHKSSLIHVNTSVGRGTAGTDINAIPPSAIKSVEVLRDGASALYGSDAIAGVINFQLKNAPDVGNIQVSAGQTYESDGTTFTASANKGFAFGDDGFINLTYEYRNRENTNRAGLQGTCQYLCTGGMADPSTEALEIAFDRQNFRIGDSDSEQHVVFANLGYTLSENAEFYAFGSYGHRENESGGFYRRANQGDRTLLEFYPNGFLPLIRPTVEDKSLAGGIDWVLADNFTVDTSLNYGSNSFNFEIANSNNVSLGLSSPTVFDAGTLELSEWNANIDAVYTMDVEALEAVTVAFGGGFRKENYQLIAGEPASFADGGFTNVDNTFSPPLFAPTAGAVGAQVFRGFSPDNEVDESRDSYSAYIEVSADLTDRINAQAAGRYENYEGFGGVFTWKFAALARLVDGVNVRGSVSTGFRAPSMQQLYFNSTSTQFVDVMGMVVAQERGTFRNDSTLAQGLGIPELKEEESFSWGAGVVLQPADGITLTVDYYSIDIDDRIMISGAQGRDAVPGAAQAVYDAVGATSGQFFINGVDTETTGVDIVGTYNVPGDIIDG